MSRAIHSKSRTIRLPDHVYVQLKQLNEVYDKFEEENDRQPSIKELANIMGVKEDTIRTLIRHRKTPISIDSTINDDEESELIDFIPDDTNLVKDYENKNVGEIDYRIDNKLYLKDFKYQNKNHDNNINIDFYSDKEDKLNLVIVVKNGNTFTVTFAFLSMYDKSYIRDTVDTTKWCQTDFINASKIALINNKKNSKYTYTVTDTKNSISSVVKAFNKNRRDFPSRYRKFKVKLDAAIANPLPSPL